MSIAEHCLEQPACCPWCRALILDGRPQCRCDDEELESTYWQQQLREDEAYNEWLDSLE